MASDAKATAEAFEDRSGGLALDFLNTVRLSRGRLLDDVRTPEHLVAWLVRAGLLTAGPLHDARGSPSAARILLTEAHRLRLEIGALVQAFSAGEWIPEDALFGVNRALGARRTAVSVNRTPEGLRLVEREAGGDLLAALAPLALSAARLVTGVGPSRIRRCASEQCLAWFVDTSKGGRRRWCSMARCGNRAKAAKHRGRAAPR